MVKKKKSKHRKHMLATLVLLLAIVFIFGFSFTINFSLGEKHEVWDCTYDDEDICVRNNITSYQLCLDNEIPDVDDCHRTSEGIENVLLYTDEGNYITSKYTEENYTIEKINIGHNSAWDAEFLDDGSLIYTEMEGRVVWHSGEEVIDQANIDTTRIGNSGLLGIAADPEFYENRYVYVYYYHSDRESHEAIEDPIYNRVSRFEFREGELRNETVLIDEIEGNKGQSGGRMAIGPDEKLYITTGEAEYGKSGIRELKERIQDLDFLGGKVLRVNLDGSIPEDNPFDNYVYAYGLRNPQGIDFHPESDRPFISVHGPWRYDEINALEPGANYGWPGEKCGYEYHDIEVENTSDSFYCFKDWTIAPSGTTFVDDESHPWYNSYFVTGLRGSVVYRLVLDGEELVDSEVFYMKKELPYSDINNRLRNIEFHNGSLYLFGDGHGAAKLTPNQ